MTNDLEDYRDRSCQHCDERIGEGPVWVIWSKRMKGWVPFIWHLTCWIERPEIEE